MIFYGMKGYDIWKEFYYTSLKLSGTSTTESYFGSLSAEMEKKDNKIKKAFFYS